MEQALRYHQDESAIGDYAELTGWSEHTSYKTHPHEHSVYTSDYGSYSSQESNHSGTTYSNLADCEEALHSPTIAYDMPSPQFTSTEKRRDKPLPPPRLTSKTLSNNHTRIYKAAKEKKISFDDSALNRASHQTGTEPDSQVPSFATLPRKKKQAGNTNADRAPVAPQVTWMKEVAQKGESINRSKNVNSIGNKKPQGILKNKIESVEKTGDTTGYIKRNTVQRIMEQQRAAKIRMPAAAAPKQVYKSQTHLASLPVPDNARQQKPWEYSTNNSAVGSTAQVIGVVEPGQDVGLYMRHTKENFSETQLEFPPPPSAKDISKLMLGHTVSAASQHNDSVHLGQLNTARDGRYTQSKERANKPPVPHRSTKLVKNSTNTSTHLNPSNFHKVGHEQTLLVQRQSLPTYNTGHPPPVRPDKSTRAEDYQPGTCTMSPILSDIVLPPPEFQEGNECAALATQQPSYGDYEVLSQDCTIPPPSSQSYHHTQTIRKLTASFEDGVRIKEQGRMAGHSIKPLNGILTRNHKLIGAVHHHQYSTEL